MIRRGLWAAVAGGLFGFGLVLSRMIDPRRVQGFLDLAHWDPTLMLVMVSAVSTTMIGYRFVLKRPRPVVEGRFQVPAATAIDRRLALGAAVFGIGWGLAGYCPGPALTAAVLGFREPLFVVAGIIAGSLLFDLPRLHASRKPGR